MTPNADLGPPLKACHEIYGQKLNTLEGQRRKEKKRKEKKRKEKKKSLFSCLEADAPNL